MEGIAVTAGVLSLLAWIYLYFFHGRFWRSDQWIEPAFETGTPIDGWPEVAVVVPARDEAAGVERCLTALLEQDYPGRFVVFLVDDDSHDETPTIAARLAREHPQGERLQVLTTATRPSGWVGKMWAVETGVQNALRQNPETQYLLLTDADVAHHAGSLRRLVRKARAHGLDLVSLMVRLHCERPWERLLVPAFVYFFQQLYPFPRVNDPTRATAGAAGGCMLVRSEALENAGGIERVRGAIIDDCTLGAALKERGRVWLGLSRRDVSFRPYEGLQDIWNMVARSAYTQLDYSPWRLAGTVLGLLLVYIVPPLLGFLGLVLGQPTVALPALAALVLLCATYLPTLDLYGLPRAYALTLPLAGLLYTAMTVDSGLSHYRGRGAVWKDRVGAGIDPPDP